MTRRIREYQIQKVNGYEVWIYWRWLIAIIPELNISFQAKGKEYERDLVLWVRRQTEKRAKP